MTREDAIKVLTREKDYVQQKIQEAVDGDGYVSPDGLIRADDYIEACTLAISTLRAQQETEKNEPLTLDELREMDGEPVYIVYLYPGYGKYFHGCWEIIERAGKWGWNGIHGEYFESNYESMWLAYRRKPEEVQK